MIKEKWPYLLVVFLLVGVGFFYLQCQTPKTEVSLGDQVNPKETPLPKVDTKESQDVQKVETPKVVDIVIDLKGEVEKPGVYHMSQGDRIVDVLEKAGGLTKKADKKKVNFAKKLTDEMMVYIPAVGEVLPENLEVAPGSTTQAGNAKININTATEQELEQIPGIGPSKAAAIIEYREKNGLYQNVTDLDKVSGFGEKTVDRLKDLITVQ
jgi:competence protein ComEA